MLLFNAVFPTPPLLFKKHPDGRVFGKMGHSERIGKDLYRNVLGEYDIRMFEAAVKYFK